MTQAQQPRRIPMARIPLDQGPSIYPLPSRPPHQRIAPASERSEAELQPSANASQDVSPFAFTETFRGYNPGGFDDSTVTTGFSEWGSVPHDSSGGPPLRSFTMSQISRRPAREDYPFGSTVTSETMDTFSQLSTADAGPIHSRRRISSEHLIEAAEALEERASSPRQLARRSQAIDSTHYGVQQHVPPPQQMVQPSNPNQLAFGALLTSVAEMPYQFDPTTIFHPEGYAEFAVFWAARPALRSVRLRTASFSATDNVSARIQSRIKDSSVLRALGVAGGLDACRGRFMRSFLLTSKPLLLLQDQVKAERLIHTTCGNNHALSSCRGSVTCYERWPNRPQSLLDVARHTSNTGSYAMG
ncbi:hypothetical protein LTR56_025940 [Elasticomyces elasticus]|nr:hypothetical protein LTR56_025940 [Elasticomyces elasticus]KAK5737974.1 hypothetical protein LTS12_025732 [Elasticomyces elasticus]